MLFRLMLCLKYRPRIEKFLFFAAIVGYVVMFFPGLMSGDSNTMYKYATTNTYCSNTSYMIVWVWNKLNYIYRGPALMFLVNMVLLWGSIYIFAFKLFRSPISRYALILVPYTMWIKIYAGWIWKDTLLAFGYTFLCAVLCWKEKQNMRFSWAESVVFWFLLLYCTEVKWVQTRFIVPLLILWFVQVQWPFWARFKRNLTTVGLSAVLMLTIYASHSFMQRHASNHQTYSWQYVNIYDLAGMSIYAHKNLVPEFLVVKPGLQDLKKKYSLAWEPLINESDSPLRATQSDEERTLLTKAWRDAVLHHPVAYLYHRSFVLFRGMLDVNFSLNPEGKLKFLYGYPFIFQALKFLRGTVFSFAWVFFTSISLCTLCLTSATRRMSQIALSFLLIHSVYSLAGTPRYIYLSTILCMVALIYALDGYLANKTLKRPQ